MTQAINIYELLNSATPMPLDDFWALIEEANDIHATEKLSKDEALGQLLAPKPPAEVARYFKTFRELSAQINNDEAYAVLGGSDDGFTDGRAWAISMGRAYYEQILNSPATLAGTPTEQYEIFAYVPSYATESGKHRDKYLSAGLARLESAALGAQIPEAPHNLNGPALRV